MMDNENEWYRWYGIMSPRRVVSFDETTFFKTLGVDANVDALTDEQLFARAKKQLAALRLTQAEIAKRHNARQAPAKAVCGHNARDHSGLCCDDPSCPRFVPF